MFREIRRVVFDTDNQWVSVSARKVFGMAIGCMGLLAALIMGLNLMIRGDASENPWLAFMTIVTFAVSFAIILATIFLVHPDPME